MFSIINYKDQLSNKNEQTYIERRKNKYVLTYRNYTSVGNTEEEAYDNMISMLKAKKKELAYLDLEPNVYKNYIK